MRTANKWTIHCFVLPMSSVDQFCFQTLSWQCIDFVTGEAAFTRDSVDRFVKVFTSIVPVKSNGNTILCVP